MANLTAQDLIPLASVFNANIDHARFTGSHVEKQAKLEAVRQERESLEAAQRRRREIEIHYSRLQRIHLEKRLSKLSEPRPDVAVAARARLATDVANDAAAHVQGQRSDGAAAALDEARKNFSVALDRAEPKLRERREWAQKDALKAVQKQLAAVESKRAATQEAFAAELQGQATLAKEQQKLELAKRLQRDEVSTHEALRRSLFLAQPTEANAADAPGVAPMAPVEALVQSALKSAPASAPPPSAPPSAPGTARGESSAVPAQVTMDGSTLPLGNDTSISIEQQGGTCNVYLANPQPTTTTTTETTAAAAGAVPATPQALLGSLLGGAFPALGGASGIAAASGVGIGDASGLQQLVQLQALQAVHACMLASSTMPSMASQPPPQQQRPSAPFGLPPLVTEFERLPPTVPSSPARKASPAREPPPEAQQAKRGTPPKRARGEPPANALAAAAPAAEQAKEPPIELRGRPQRPITPTARPISPRDRSKSPSSGRDTGGSMAQEESFDADEMEDMLRQSMIDSAERKKEANAQAKRKEAEKRAAEERGEDLAPWRRDASKTAVPPAPEFRPMATAAPAPSGRQPASPSLNDDRDVLGLANALQARGEMWSRREAEAAVATWRSHSSAHPANEHKKSLELWGADKTHGLAVCTAAQVVNSIRGLVKSRHGPLLPAAFLDLADPTLEKLELALAPTEWHLFRCTMRHLCALAKSASLPRSAQCTLLAPILLPPASEGQAEMYSRVTARLLDTILPPIGGSLPPWLVESRDRYTMYSSASPTKAASPTASAAPAITQKPPVGAATATATAPPITSALSQRRGLTQPSPIDTPKANAAAGKDVQLKSPGGEDLLEASFGGSEVPSELDMSQSYGASPFTTSPYNRQSTPGKSPTGPGAKHPSVPPVPSSKSPTTRANAAAAALSAPLGPPPSKPLAGGSKPTTTLSSENVSSSADDLPKGMESPAEDKEYYSESFEEASVDGSTPVLGSRTPTNIPGPAPVTTAAMSKFALNANNLAEEEEFGDAPESSSYLAQYDAPAVAAALPSSPGGIQKTMLKFEQTKMPIKPGARARACSIDPFQKGSGLLQPGSTLPVTALGGAQGYSAKSAPAVVQNAPMSSSSSEEKASAAPSSSVRVASSDPPTTKASGSSAPGANVLKLSKSDASIESEMSSVDDGAPIQGTKDAIAKLDSLPNSPLKAPAAAAGRQIQGRRGSAGYGGPQLNTSIAPSKPLYGGGGGGAGGGSSGIGNKPLRMDKAGGEMALEDSLSSDDVDAFPQPRSLGGMGGGLGASRLAPRAAPGGGPPAPKVIKPPPPSMSPMKSSAALDLDEESLDGIEDLGI